MTATSTLSADPVCGTHTGARVREHPFLLFAFFGIFPVAPGIVSRFVIVIRLHPAKRGLYSPRSIHPVLPLLAPVLNHPPARLPLFLPPPGQRSLATCARTGRIESRLASPSHPRIVVVSPAFPGEGWISGMALILLSRVPSRDRLRGIHASLSLARSLARSRNDSLMTR